MRIINLLKIWVMIILVFCFFRSIGLHASMFTEDSCSSYQNELASMTTRTKTRLERFSKQLQKLTIANQQKLKAKKQTQKWCDVAETFSGNTDSITSKMVEQTLQDYEHKRNLIVSELKTKPKCKIESPLQTKRYLKEIKEYQVKLSKIYETTCLTATK